MFCQSWIGWRSFRGFKGHKNPLVYVIAPWSTFYVEPISKNLEDFLSMLLTLKNANFFTFISSSSKEEFLKIGDEDPIPDELLELIYLSKLVEKRYASLEDVYLAVKKYNQISNYKMFKIFR